MDILTALREPTLFGQAFSDLDTWVSWESFLAACFGLPLTPVQLATFQRHSGRAAAPTRQAREAWVVVGRRGGKSRIAALTAVWLATRDYRNVLAPGEVGTLPVVAADRRQARTVVGYISALFDGSPLLARLVEKRTAEAIELVTGVRIEIHTASWRALRGYTIIGAVLDEVAFWRSEESANPDREIVNALRPAMATVPGALLVAISSPYARRGVLWEQYRAHFAQDGDPVLVWQAPTIAMNPRVPVEIIETAYADDEPAAAAEYGAEFRRDIEAFLSREAIDAVVVPGRRELPPGGQDYVAFVDPSGGSADAFTLAIAHADRRDGQITAVLDCARECRPPFSPEAVVAEFAALLMTYKVRCVRGDRYAGEWPRDAFSRHGVSYDTSDKSKSELYQEVLPLVNAARVELLDLARLQQQLVGLERRTTRGGRDSIDHGPGAHDDLANAVAGALVLAATANPPCEIYAANLAAEPYRPVDWESIRRDGLF